METPLTSIPLGALCARHPTIQALAICTRCGCYICSSCYAVGADGHYYCFECDQRVPNLAERGDRFVANLVDNVLLVLPMFGAGIFGALSSRRGGSEGMAILLGVLGTVGVIGYQLALAQQGQSIGKRMRNLRVVRTDGSPVSLVRILLLRNFLPAVIGSFCGIFGLIDALTIFGEERRCIHDMLADTKVVEATSDTENG